LLLFLQDLSSQSNLSSPSDQLRQCLLQFQQDQSNLSSPYDLWDQLHQCSLPFQQDPSILSSLFDPWDQLHQSNQYSQSIPLAPLHQILLHQLHLLVLSNQLFLLHLC
jgi:hypothetical protein